MTAAENPMTVMVGGNHYLGMKIQPTEFWARNQMPAMEGSIVKYLSRHAAKAGRQDVEKCIDFANKMLWWYFDAPEESRAVPQHWRGHHSYALSPEDYCEQNRLSAEETAAILLVCRFTCRLHIEQAIDALQQVIQRDYAHVVPQPPALNMDHKDALYLAKDSLEEYLRVLETVGGTPKQIGRLKARIDMVNREWRKA